MNCSKKSKSKTKNYTCLTKKELASLCEDIKDSDNNLSCNSKKSELYKQIAYIIGIKEDTWWKNTKVKDTDSIKYLLHRPKNGKNLKRWLSSEELKRIVYQNIKNHKTFLGCFPCDYFEKDDTNLLNKGSSIIFNTSKKNEKGKHWVALHYDFNHCIHYFDPLGKSPNIFIMRFIKKIKNVKNIYINKAVYQEKDGTCGDFCVFFIIIMDKFNTKAKLDTIPENKINKIVRTEYMYIS